MKKKESSMFDNIANMGENMGGDVGDIFKKINTVRNMPGADVDSDDEKESKKENRFGKYDE